jgi:hypothetical protein
VPLANHKQRVIVVVLLNGSGNSPSGTAIATEKVKLEKADGIEKVSLPEPMSNQAPKDFCRTFLTQAEN